MLGLLHILLLLLHYTSQHMLAMYYCCILYPCPPSCPLNQNIPYLVAIVDSTHAGKQPPSTTGHIALVRFNQTADVWLEELLRPQLDLVTVSLGREFNNQNS